MNQSHCPMDIENPVETTTRQKRHQKTPKETQLKKINTKNNPTENETTNPNKKK